MATPKLAVRQADFESLEDLSPALERLAAGDFDVACSLLLEAHRRHPDDPRAGHFLGMFHFDCGRIDEARKAFAAASATAPGVSVYAYNEGAAALMLGRPHEALSAFLRSLNGDELLPDAHRWAWNALSGCGKFDVALNRLRAALERDQSMQRPRPTADRVELPTVTLCAVDCVHPALTARALQQSMARCRFHAVKLLTSATCTFEGIETTPILHIGSFDEYSRFIVKELWQYVDTDFVLVTQWDGYVVNAAAWTAAFLDYDFIGASWDDDLVKSWGVPPGHNVGNGGFSLRSRRLLRAGADPNVLQTSPEDAQLCRTYRPFLEQQYGIRFADRATADRFSFEANRPDTTPFGFHGSYNICCFEPEPHWMRFGFLDPRDLADCDVPAGIEA